MKHSTASLLIYKRNIFKTVAENIQFTILYLHKNMALFWRKKRFFLKRKVGDEHKNGLERNPLGTLHTQLLKNPVWLKNVQDLSDQV